MQEKTESEIILTHSLEAQPLTLVDITEKSLTFSKYEELRYYLNSSKALYKATILEYANIYSELSEKLNETIEEISKNLSTYKNNPHLAVQLLKNKFNISPYSNKINTLHPASLRGDGLLDLASLKAIYDTYGLSGAESYIRLCTNPKLLSQYLNDSEKQTIATQFLLKKSGYKSSIPIKRDYSPKTMYELTESGIKETLGSITDQKESFVNFINDKKEEVSSWIINKQQEYDNIKETNDKNIHNLETTYEKKLQLASPVVFMKERCSEYAKSFRLWSLISALLSLLIVIIIVIAVTPAIENTAKILTIKLFNKELPVYSNIAILAIITLLAYLVKTTIKIALSARHMEQEYKQKYILTDFLLTLSKDISIDNNTKNTIILSLFEKADTGLVKYDTSESSVVSALSQIAKSASK